MESDCQFVPGLYDAAVEERCRRSGGGGGGGERRRRFTEEQVRSLETTFHSRRAKALEPREKAELARELGLQPRQVAIWFQNKRARWRSKQLEHDFADLSAQYDALRARVESIQQEKLVLAARLEELREKLKEPQDVQSGSCCVDDNSAAEAEDYKRIYSGSCVVSEDSPAAAAGWYDDHLGYGGALLHEPFCAATPELWAETWPPVEWNAVA